MFKKFFLVKLLPCVLCLVILMSSIKMASVNATGPITDGLLSVIASTIFSSIKLGAGVVIKDIGENYGNDEFEEFTSFIDTWVLFNGQYQRSIETLEACKQILSDVTEINMKLDKYNVSIQKNLANLDANSKYIAMNNKWDNDVTSVYKENELNGVIYAYNNCIKAGDEYRNIEGDNTAALNKYNISKDKFFLAFSDCYVLKSGIGFDSSYTLDDKKSIVFNSNLVDVIMKNTIQDLCAALQYSTTYVDAAAQFAFSAFPFAEDQYEYISLSMSKQITEIVKIEMIYQEFLAQRSDYFKENCKDDSDINEDMKQYRADLDAVNEYISNSIIEYYNRDITVNSNGLLLNLNDYVRPEDIGSVELTNNQYKNTYTDIDHKYFNDFYGENYLTEDISTDAKYYDDKVYFDKVSSVTNQGVNLYYVLSDNNNADMHMKSMTSHFVDSRTRNKNVYKYEGWYFSADYLNLTQCNYSDGNNSFKSIKNMNEFSPLIDNNNYLLTNSNPSNYLSNNLEYAKGKNLYLLTSTYNINYSEPFFISLIRDSYTAELEFASANLSASQASLPLLKSNYNCKTATDENKLSSDMYTVVLKNQNKELTYSTDTKVTGDGEVDFYINSVNGEKLESNNKSVESNIGDKLTITYKPSYDTCIKSLSLVNNDTNKVIKEYSNEDLSSMLSPDKNGYYTFEYSQSYSNYSFVIDTEQYHSVDVKSITGMDTGKIEFDKNINPKLILKDDVVTFTVSEDITDVYLNDIKEENKINLTKDAEGNYKGSFVMPYDNVELHYKSNKSSFEIDEYGFYLINNYEELETAIEVYNRAIIKDHDFKLANDIIAPDNTQINNSFGEDESFTGIFDGNNHKISNLKFSTQISGLFSNLSGTIKDLNIESSIEVNGPDNDIYTSNYSGVVNSADGATIENVNAEIDININSPLLSCINIGGIVSEATNTSIENCTAYGEITVQNSNIIFLGGIAGITKNCDITNITNNVKITSNSISTLNVGGLIGEDTNSSIYNSVNNAEINNKSIYTSITTGGIIGIAENSIVENCINNGNYIIQQSQTVNVGGILGVAYSSVSVNNLNNGNIISTENDVSCIDCIGGIIGMTTQDAMVISNCNNRGTLSSDSVMLCIGGVLGKGKSHLINCANTASIEIPENDPDLFIKYGDLIGYQE